MSLMQTPRLTHSVNFSFQLYNTGLGTNSGKHGRPDRTYFDFAISPAITFGSPTLKNPATLNTFHNDAASGVVNNHKYSATLGSNFAWNSVGRNQRVGYAGFKLNKFGFNFYNDVIPFLGDDDDR